VCAKAEPAINCNDTGKQMDFNDEQLEKAIPSISFNCDPESNVIDDSDVQAEKQPSQRI
jgi:hypothetical protein